MGLLKLQMPPPMTNLLQQNHFLILPKQFQQLGTMYPNTKGSILIVDHYKN